jgi:hypothetical protein
MSTPIKAPKKKKAQKPRNSPEEEVKKIKKGPEGQNTPERPTSEEQRDESNNQKGFENEPLKEEDIDSLFML